MATRRSTLTRVQRELERQRRGRASAERGEEYEVRSVTRAGLPSRVAPSRRFSAEKAGDELARIQRLNPGSSFVVVHKDAPYIPVHDPVEHRSRGGGHLAAREIALEREIARLSERTADVDMDDLWDDERRDLVELDRLEREHEKIRQRRMRDAQRKRGRPAHESADMRTTEGRRAVRLEHVEERVRVVSQDIAYHRELAQYARDAGDTARAKEHTRKLEAARAVLPRYMEEANKAGGNTARAVAEGTERARRDARRKIEASAATHVLNAAETLRRTPDDPAARSRFESAKALAAKHGARQDAIAAAERRAQVPPPTTTPQRRRGGQAEATAPSQSRTWASALAEADRRTRAAEIRKSSPAGIAEQRVYKHTKDVAYHRRLAQYAREAGDEYRAQKHTADLEDARARLGEAVASANRVGGDVARATSEGTERARRDARREIEGFAVTRLQAAAETLHLAPTPEAQARLESAKALATKHGVSAEAVAEAVGEGDYAGQLKKKDLKKLTAAVREWSYLQEGGDASRDPERLRKARDRVQKLEDKLLGKVPGDAFQEAVDDGRTAGTRRAYADRRARGEKGVPENVPITPTDAARAAKELDEKVRRRVEEAHGPRKPAAQAGEVSEYGDKEHAERMERQRQSIREFNRARREQAAAEAADAPKTRAQRKDEKVMERVRAYGAELGAGGDPRRISERFSYAIERAAAGAHGNSPKAVYEAAMEAAREAGHPNPESLVKLTPLAQQALEGGGSAPRQAGPRSPRDIRKDEKVMERVKSYGAELGAGGDPKRISTRFSYAIERAAEGAHGNSPRAVYEAAMDAARKAGHPNPESLVKLTPLAQQALDADPPDEKKSSKKPAKKGRRKAAAPEAPHGDRPRAEAKAKRPRKKRKKSPQRKVQVGKRGGRFIITASGNKRYIGRR